MSATDNDNSSTVVLKLRGPLMAWGLDADWETRPTMSRPTKSGVLGLVANALGRDEADDISDLAALRFSVRADRPGQVIMDDQTAGGGTFPPLPADIATDPVLAKKPEKWAYGAPRGPYMSDDGRLLAPWTAGSRGTLMIRKAYIADAAFLAGLTGSPGLIETVAAGLDQPARLLYLGRRNCPLSCSPLHTVVAEPDWQLHVPLLAEATTSRPRFWCETTVRSGRPSGEQPGRYDTRQKTLTYMADSRVTPPRHET